jgi:hypothetical protein
MSSLMMISTEFDVEDEFLFLLKHVVVWDFSICFICSFTYSPHCGG